MIDFLNSLGDLSNVSAVIRLVMATVLGSLVGMERANKRYAAGLRTFALVCLGSALATIAGIYFAEMSGNMADMARIPAQLLCGIGFLGAGTIIVTERKQIRGLTTAAGLWVTASMGIAIGAGLYVLSLACFVLILITNYYMHYMTQYIESHTRRVEIHVEVSKEGVPRLLDFIKSDLGYGITSMERRSEPPIIDDDVILRMEIDMGRKMKHAVLLNDVIEFKEVHYAEIIT